MLDGSALHEVRLVFGGVLQAARVHVSVEQWLVRARHHRGTVVGGGGSASGAENQRASADVCRPLPSAVFPQSGAGGRGDGGDAVRVGVPVSAPTRHHQWQNPQHRGGTHRVHRPAGEEQQ